MANIKVRDLTDTTAITTDNQVMVLTDDAQNQVQNITVGDLLTNVISSDADNVLEQGTDNKLYVQTPEAITGDLEDLNTSDKYTLVGAINELNGDIGDLSDLQTSVTDDIVGAINAAQADLETTIGELEDLETSSKYSIIDAINSEVIDRENADIDIENDYNGKIGNLSSLDTSDKTSIVNAINELSSVLDPTQTADYINNSKAVESGSVSSNSIVYADIKKYAHSSFDLSKFTVVGDPTITDDGIASGFSTSNYLTKSNAITIGSSGEFHIDFEFDYVSHTDHQYIWDLYNTTSDEIILRREGNSYRVVSFVNGTAIFNNAIVAQEGALHVKGFFEYKNSVYTLDINGVQFQLTSSTKMNALTYNLSLGARLSSGTAQQPFTNGSIDLKEFSITVDGVEVFSGNKTGIDVIKPDDYTMVGTPTITNDGIASGFSSSNYLTKVLNFYSAISWKIQIPYKTSNDFSVMQRIIDRASGNNYVGFYINTNKKCGGFVQVSSTNLSFTATTSNSVENNTDYLLTVSYKEDTYEIKFVKMSDNSVIYEATATSNLAWGNEDTAHRIGTGADTSYYCFGSIDLNSFKIYVDGNLVYQPCLKIPYTAGSNQYGGKYVDVAYRNRVQDAYEQGLANDYFTIDEENQNFTLPMGEIYGMIGDKVSKKGDTMTGTLEINRQQSELGGPTYLKFTNTGYDFNNPVVGHQNEYLTFFDKNGIDLATIQHRFGTSYNDLFLRVRPLGDTTTSISMLPGLAMRTLANGDTFAYAPASDVTDSILTTAAINKAGNGYVKLGNGIIFQWGSFASGNYRTTKEITFPTAFPTKAHVFFNSNYQQTTGDSGCSCGVTNVTTTKFTYYSGFEQSNPTVYWFAIGY